MCGQVCGGAATRAVTVGIPVLGRVMTWQRLNRYTEINDAGYRVSAALSLGQWRFSAWPPPERPDLTYWQWRSQAPHQVHYDLGQFPPRRCRLLAIFGSADEARAWCDAHAVSEAG